MYSQITKLDNYFWNSFDAQTRFSVLKRLQIAWHGPFKLGKMKTKTTNGDNIHEMLSSIGVTTFGENIAADNSPPTSLTKLAGIWLGARGQGKGERISFPSFVWDALFQLTLEVMVALWGATNDHDKQGHHQMPQWIPPTLTSSSSFSRFVIRPWSSGNWSANQTTQTLLSCDMLQIKVQSNPRHWTWVRAVHWPEIGSTWQWQAFGADDKLQLSKLQRKWTKA